MLRIGAPHLLGVLLAVLLAWTTSALAQGAPPLTPPRARGSTDVSYPPKSGGAQGAPRAEGDASVELELIVERDGTVSHAEVIEGREPFAEHARRAALTWTFFPARRGDTAVRARTRARVAFRQELEETSSPPAASSPPPAGGPATSSAGGPAATGAGPVTSSEHVEQVTVRGIRREIGQTTLSAKDVREMPGAFGDPFRAIEALPGVTPVISGAPYFFIRGAPPNNNGYFLDGVRVPVLFHVGLGPGVIHPALLDRVEMYPGAAPASYGGFAGAIVAGRTRDPATSFHGEANVRLVDAGALLEAPFAGGRGTALVAGRYGYPGPMVGAFSDTTLGYWDYQTRVTWRIGERGTLGLFAFGAHDYLAHVERSGKTEEDFVSDFHRVDLRYDHALTDGRLRIAATVGYDSQGASPSYLTDTSGAVRLEVEKKLSSAVRVRGGADLRLDVYRFRQGEPAGPYDTVVPSNVDPPPTNVSGAAYADMIWRVAPRVEMVPGVRVGIFASSRDNAVGATDGASRVSTTEAAVDPRLSVRVTLAPAVAWLSTFGLAHQYPALRVGSVPAPVVTGAGFPFGQRRLQTAAHASQGLEIGLPADLVLTATGFLSGWSGLTDLTANCIEMEPGVVPPNPSGAPRPPLPVKCPNNEPVNGRAYGVELLLRRPLSKRLSGWLSYTLSRSTRAARFVTFQGEDAIATVPSEFDRTHVLNAVLSYDVGRRWRFGTRFMFYSGAPYSPLDGSVPVPPYHSQRDPPFVRLDVRLEKRWPLGKTGSIAFVFEGQNLTLSKERTGLGTDCNGVSGPEGGTTECTRSEVGPITIPSMGVEAFF
ncbi:TonB-dependent receptor domain-containing protein [Pendulispora albinea]|uniref:TonB-dependent receptor plug domain-containing protein n=1 Tax=Pendulispora albinea TaxID=2741071 RepID=A0ABZ2M7I7_9BACT